MQGGHKNEITGSRVCDANVEELSATLMKGGESGCKQQ